MRILPGLLLAALALTACGDTENLYSSAYCRLTFDNSTHNDATLASAMTPTSGGVFVTITASGTTFSFSSNQGLSSTTAMTALEQQRGFSLGYNNGIIVGYGTVDNTFYCYDRECPNCFDPEALPVKSYKITVNTFGIASCSTCHRKYDCNSGGLVSDGDAGTKLTRYRATTTGPYGVLTI